MRTRNDRTGETAVSPSVLAEVEYSLKTMERSRDEFPPLTTHRHGWRARLEISIKRWLKHTTHWFFWRQANFNSAAYDALTRVELALKSHEQRLRRIESGLGIARNESMPDLESSLRSEIINIRDEHRVICKQLSLEVSETAVTADRSRRRLEMRIDGLQSLMEELRAELSAARREEATRSKGAGHQ